MRLAMQRDTDAAALVHGAWDIALVGDDVDERGRAAVGFARESATAVHRVSYDPSTLDLTVNGVTEPADSAQTLRGVVASSSVLLEATTLGFVEVYLACVAARESASDLTLLYTEPAAYHAPRRHHVLHRRDFDLSDAVEDFSGLPGSALLLTSQFRTRVLFLVGYEGQRLEQALEQTGVRPANCAVVFGVPAFHPGWEMDSLANNVRVIDDRSMKDVRYAGAQDPQAVLEVLEREYAALGDGERLLVGPIGTKPHGIGVALFASRQPERFGVVYDHPQRSRGRSDRVAAWHLFQVMAWS